MRKLSATPGSGQAPDVSQGETLKRLLPYLWPASRPDLKARVVVALVLLVASKLVTVVTPYAFKAATDALSVETSRDVSLLSVPVFMVLAYGA